MGAMTSTVGVMQEADKNMSIGDVTKMLTDFEKAGMKMEMKNDAMTDAMG